MKYILMIWKEIRSKRIFRGWKQQQNRKGLYFLHGLYFLCSSAYRGVNFLTLNNIFSKKAPQNPPSKVQRLFVTLIWTNPENFESQSRTAAAVSPATENLWFFDQFYSKAYLKHLKFLKTANFLDICRKLPIFWC